MAKSVLASIVDQQAALIADLDKRVAALEAEVAALKASPAVATVAQRPARAAYVPPAPTPLQLAYRAMREKHRAAAVVGKPLGVLPSFAQFERDARDEQGMFDTIYGREAA